MIEVKANADIREHDMHGSAADIHMYLSMEGYGEQLVHEAISIIKGISEKLHDKSEYLHSVFLMAIAREPEILTCSTKQESSEAKLRVLAEAMSRGIIDDKGVN